jgi:hypothetical protein
MTRKSFRSYGGITRAPDSRYLVAGAQLSQGGALMAVAYYNSDLTPDTSVGDQGIVTISVPVSTTLTNPTGVGLRAVYTPDGSRTVIIGSIHGQKAVMKADGTPAIDANGQKVYNDAEHIVVARIWN